MASQMHKRKSSADDEKDIMITEPPSQVFPNTSPGPKFKLSPPPPRSRVNSTPAQTFTSSSSFPIPPPSAGPFRTGFNLPSQPPHTTSPFRTSFPASNNLTVNGHSRTRTVSTPYSPSTSSPLASTFPQSVKQGQLVPPNMATSKSAPEANFNNGIATTNQQHARRHSRVHSRNLSIFFPRPGSLPQTTITEDGSQELQIGLDDEEAALPIPSADSNISVPGRHRRQLSTHSPVTPLGVGFTFGVKPPRPPGSGNPIPPPMIADDSSSSSTSGSRTRRGHHHKHSLSHNFFSFLEPGADQQLQMPAEELHTQPTPIPMSPWNPISPFPLSPPPTRSSSTQPQPLPPGLGPSGVSNGHVNVHGHGNERKARLLESEEPPEVLGVLGWGICQFALGGWMWVAGQQNGSLSVTGLGYWVVFHAFGVAVRNVLPKWRKLGDQGDMRRSYGDARIETVLMFAQSVYLMFAAVYICKETVEHVLLAAGSSGGGEHEGHHHHHADDSGQYGINFPLLSISLSLVSIVISGFFYGTHSKLVEITGNRIPSIGRLIRSLYSSHHRHVVLPEPPPTSPIGVLISNPYVLSPFMFCLAVMGTSVLVSSSNHIACDLTLAGLMTVVTFNLAYRASVVLGTVLLQTAPVRGQGGRMEAFLRVMREIERHPNVVHVTPPHLWQLTPTPPNPSRFEGNSSLVATLELHVKKELGDEDVLALTKWAWERLIFLLSCYSLGSRILRFL
ncbi:hypothetical protein E1B28_006685 [Marasmius oreades]|uniref:Uncharacterized protein n=1 Tax=Marasmius oreades TaxID=181124 RepID=A0A9P7UWN8_9AGAR|nr:uncharacterized protein E1B28_006685 [Marasmius oreades]KAG7096003.1 hypothetical protein E1B28_006685 [Marasmius oreades]